MMKKINLYYVIAILAILFSACSGAKEDNQEVEQAEEAAPTEVSIVGEEVTYSTDSTTMKGYVAYDENKQEKVPGILVVHEWWGHNDYARKRADMLAELGYVALAVDMYGDGKTAEHPDDAGKFSGMVMSNIDAAQARFVKAMEQLKSNPHVDPERIGAIGYCFGGSVVLTMANLGLDLDAVAAFHSGVQLPVMPGENEIKAQVLVCNGADDPFIAEGTPETYQAAMDSVGADYKYIAYEGAVHSFTREGADEVGEKFNLPLAYNKEADEASWEELKALLNDAL